MNLRAALSRFLSLLPGKGRPQAPSPLAPEQKMRRPGRDYEDKMRRTAGDKGSNTYTAPHDPSLMSGDPPEPSWEGIGRRIVFCEKCGTALGESDE